MDARRGAKQAWAAMAVIAWCGVVLVVLLSALGQFASSPPTGHLYGTHAHGIAGAVSRTADTLSYFTMWSNIVVAVAFTLLARQPDVDGTARRVLLADALVMITVTGIVYALLLAPQDNPTGWSVFTNLLQHIVVPVGTVLVWLVWGPRGRLGAKAVGLSFVIPGVWIVYMLVRGAVVNAYPYDFVDVATHGYGSVAVTLLAILVFGIVLALAFWGIDRLLARRR